MEDCAQYRTQSWRLTEFLAERWDQNISYAHVCFMNVLICSCRFAIVVAVVATSPLRLWRSQ